MKKILKYLFLFAILFLLFSFGTFSFVKSQEQEKEIQCLEYEIQKLKTELSNCQSSGDY